MNMGFLRTANMQRRNEHHEAIRILNELMTQIHAKALAEQDEERATSLIAQLHGVYLAIKELVIAGEGN